MPRTIVDTNGLGPIQDWDVVGPVPAWEAVRRGSGDTYRLETAQAFAKAYLFCGAGWMPFYGSISAITLRYRVRLDTPGQSAIIYSTLIRNGLEEFQNGPVLLTTTNWVDGYVRIRSDYITGTRWNPEFIGDLGVGLFLWSAPAAGKVQVSEMWLEVEYIDSATTYDPKIGMSLPDSISGDMQWSTNGSQFALITANDELQIYDTSALDWRTYERQDLVYPEQYITEIECRMLCFFVPFITHTGFFYYVASYETGAKSIQLVLFNVSDHYFIGLIGLGMDYGNPAGYLASYEVTPFIGQDLYFRMVVDRNPDINSPGQVRVFMNYDDVPVMQAPYSLFPDSIVNRILFGTGDPLTGMTTDRCGVRIDFFSWHHYKRGGEVFDMWRDVELGPNQVKATSSDPYIWRPVHIYPPGIDVGQSQHACQLEVVDATEECSIYQYWMLQQETPKTYDLDIIYRMDALGPQGKVSLQRRSDHWYWNDVTKMWQAAVYEVTLTNQMNRYAAPSVMSGITAAHPSNPPYPYKEVFILKIGKFSAVPVSYNMYVYKAYLR